MKNRVLLLIWSDHQCTVAMNVEDTPENRKWLKEMGENVGSPWELHASEIVSESEETP